MKRVLLFVLLCSAAAILAGVLSAGRACAHDPRFACSPRPASSPIAIPDASKSWAYYGDLRPGQRDYYEFASTGAMRVPLGLLVDQRDASNPARPELTLYDAAGRSVAHLDLGNAVKFYEPFSRVTYLSTPDRTLALPPGRFQIVVTMSGPDRPQRYAMAVGAAERFSIWEIPYVAAAAYRIHNRQF